MTEATQGLDKEVPLRKLSRLNVLVHPLHWTSPATITYQPWLDAAKIEQDAASKRFLPQDPSQLLLVMPLIRKPSWEAGESLRQNVSRVRRNSPSLNWTTMYRFLKSESPYKHGVQLAPNIVTPHEKEHETIEGRLRQLGVSIDEGTEIVVGGEWLEFCVESVAKRLLRIQEVKEVKIDKRVTMRNSNPEEYSLPVLAGAVARQDNDFVYLSKTGSS